MAHLAPIAKHFELRMIGVADPQCWAQFRRALAGGKVYNFKTRFRRILGGTEELLRKPLLFYRQRKHQRHLRSFGAPVAEFNDANSSRAIELIRTYSPDLIISAAYPQIFTEALINAAPKGAVNFHPSLLPRFRGAHPHYWCVATGEERSGITAHYLTTRLDSGDVISQRQFDITGLYYSELYKNIIELTPALVEDVATFMNDPAARPIPQNNGLATLFRNDREIHHRLDFQSMGSSELFNRVRAGGAYTLYNGKRIGIVRTEVLQRNRHMTNGITVPPGIIVDIAENGVVVATKDSKFLAIQSVQRGRKPRPFAVWVAKSNVRIGERLG